MIAKFVDLSLENSMEVEKSAEGISFYITRTGEESKGQSIIIPPTEISNLIKFLTDIQSAINLTSSIN
ncbi:MAG: hypothetical protein ABI760_12350 [Ferruginibacter sp.]